jgi:hypothetical protein
MGQSFIRLICKNSQFDNSNKVRFFKLSALLQIKHVVFRRQKIHGSFGYIIQRLEISTIIFRCGTLRHRGWVQQIEHLVENSFVWSMVFRDLGLSMRRNARVFILKKNLDLFRKKKICDGELVCINLP